MLTEYKSSGTKKASTSNGTLPSRLLFYKAKNDLTWQRFTEKVNGYLIGSDRRTISRNWLIAATNGVRVSEGVSLKLKSFLEAQGF